MSNVAKTTEMLKDRKLSKVSIIGGECANPWVNALICLEKNLNQKAQRFVLCCQLIAFLPMF